MIVVPARILQAPDLLYNDMKSFKPQNASWNLVGRKFYKPQRLQNWSYLVCGRGTFAKHHLEVLRQQITACGLGNENPNPLAGYYTTLGVSDDDKTDEALQKALQQAKTAGVKFLFVILETRSKPIHARLKFFADVVVGAFPRKLGNNRDFTDGDQGSNTPLSFYPSSRSNSRLEKPIQASTTSPTSCRRSM